MLLCWTVHLKGGPKRPFSAAEAVGHKLYSFGGYSSTNNRGQMEVHVFNTVSLRWGKLPPAVTTGTGEHLTLEVPSNCVCHTTVLIEDVIYIWGGIVDFEIEENDDWVTIQGRNCNMLYAFDVNTHRWFKPDMSGTVPEGRDDHSACVLGKVMYIYGGFNRVTGHKNDIYRLDTTTMFWSLINTGGTLAPSSELHSATIIGTKMFVFGGRGDQEIDNNIRVFDTETDCWLSPPSSAQLLPERREGHSAFAYNGELYIFGGHNFILNRYLNDLWRFNPQTFSWKTVEPKGKGPAMMTAMSCCMVGDRIVFFRAYRHRDSVLFILDLSPSLKTLCKLAVIQYGLDQSGLPYDTRWEMGAMTTSSNRNK